MINGSTENLVRVKVVKDGKTRYIWIDKSAKKEIESENQKK